MDNLYTDELGRFRADLTKPCKIVLRYDDGTLLFMITSQSDGAPIDALRNAIGLLYTIDDAMMTCNVYFPNHNEATYEFIAEASTLAEVISEV